MNTILVMYAVSKERYLFSCAYAGGELCGKKMQVSFKVLKYSLATVYPSQMKEHEKTNKFDIIIEHGIYDQN